MEKKFELLPPAMPNFISIKQEPRQRREGVKLNDFEIRVSELTDEEAEQYGELMKQAFIVHHRLHIERNKSK